MFNPSGFVKHKELPNFQSMFGNTGKSWDAVFPNDLYIKSIAKNIVNRSDTVLISGAGPVVLHSFSFPAGSLKAGNIIDGCLS